MTATTLTASNTLPARESLFGVCAAVADDFGFNPLWLRLGFALGLLVRFDAALVAYGALALAVLVSRVATLRFRPRVLPVATVTPIARRARDYPPLTKAA